MAFGFSEIPPGPFIILYTVPGGPPPESPLPRVSIGRTMYMYKCRAARVHAYLYYIIISYSGYKTIHNIINITVYTAAADAAR